MASEDEQVAQKMRFQAELATMKLEARIGLLEDMIAMIYISNDAVHEQGTYYFAPRKLADDIRAVAKGRHNDETLALLRKILCREKGSQ